jgi:2-polyprenyl-3-methyl-5-hydroxy-6-metoxy-1,4-benzoquinol methylase
MCCDLNFSEAEMLTDATSSLSEANPAVSEVGYVYGRHWLGADNNTDTYIWPKTIPALSSIPPRGSILDAGCGNGLFAKTLCRLGYRVHGIEAEPTGVESSQFNAPGASFTLGSVYDDLRELDGAPFDAVVSLEVIEHLYRPRVFVRRVVECLKPGGLFVVSTPYHGYLKNLALAVTGKFDRHFTALWDGGHIKFWSRATLTRLCESEGLKFHSFSGAGRIPFFWKAMVVVFRVPG